MSENNLSAYGFYFSYLLEKWLIAYRKNLIEDYEESSNNTLEMNLKKNALQSLFLLKRRLDPGFRTLIYEKIKENIESNPKFYKLCRRKLLAFSRVIQFFTDLKINSTHRESWRLRINYVIETLKKQYSQYPLRIFSIIQNYEGSLNYFLDVLDNFQREGEIEYLIATETLIKEILLEMDHSTEVFVTIEPFKPSVTYEKYRLFTIRFLIEEIDFEILDHLTNYGNRFPLLNNLMLTIDLSGNPLLKKVEEFLELLTDAVVVPDKNNIPDTYQSQPIGIIQSNLLTIISLIYWNSLDHQRKIQLINQFYGMTQISSYIKNNMKNIDFSDFQTLIDILFIYHYFQECTELINYYNEIKGNELSQKEFEFLHLEEIYSLMALNELDEFEIQAKKFFPELTVSFPPNLNSYDETVCFHFLLKWCEFLSKTEQKELLDKLKSFIDIAMKESEKSQQKTELLIILSYIERLKKNFKSEREYLNKALSGNWETDKKYEILNERVRDYEDIEFDLAKIENYDKKSTLQLILELSHETFFMCDFEKSQRILEENKDLYEDLFGEQKYKKKICHLLMFSSLYTKDYEKALKFLKKCLEIGPNNGYLTGYLHLINLQKDEKDILKTVSNPETFKTLSNYRNFLVNCLILFGLVKFKKVCHQILSKLKDKTEKADRALDIGNLLADLGFFSLSLEFYQYGLKKTTKKKLKGQILNGIGTVYLNLNNASKSIEYLLKAIKFDPTFRRYYENLSMAYQLIPDYSESKKAIKKAISIAKKNNVSNQEMQNLHRKLLLIEVILRGQPSINSISNEETKKLFRHAYYLDQDVYKKNLKIREVANSIFNAYANALDSLLYHTLSKPFLDKIHDKYGKNFSACNHSTKRKMDLAIKHLFKGGHLTLPQWKILLKKLRKEKVPKKLKEFPDCLPDLDEEQFELLFSTIDLLNDYRIPSVHGQITTFKEYHKEKFKIIHNLNDIINFLREF